MRLNNVYIAAGSNVEPEKNLPAGIRLLKTWFNVIAISPIYESEPVDGMPDEPRYLNAVIQIETYVFLDLFRKRLRMIEGRMGRVRYDRDGNESKLVTLDLDVLLFNNETSRSMFEPLPHPDITNHAHVAVPLADISPTKRHPVTGETFSEIAARFRDSSALKVRGDLQGM
jgi:2-amino-4-hydroxy-6-hydroxymethyldihydropteridine diphosphokinase